MNRLTHWAIPISVAALCVTVSARDAYAQSANTLFNRGRAAEARDDVEGAYNDYAKAFQKKPTDEKFKISYERLRLDAAAAHVKQGERLRDQGDNTGALTEFLRALEIDASNELASQDIRVTREKIDGEANAPVPETAMPPGERKALLDLGGVPILKPLSNEPLTVHATQDSKVVYQTIAKTAGINVLFDPDYHSSNITVDLQNVSLLDALRILSIQTGTFWRPITANTIFVAQNTRGKRTELDEQAVQTFYLTNIAQQNDLNDIQTALRNVFTVAKLYSVPSQNAIIMRGTPDELLLAGKLINDLDKARAEVVVDIAVLEVSRERMRTIGIQLPQTASINFQQSNADTTATTTTTTTSTSSLTLNSLAHLNSTNFAVSIGAAAVNLLMNDTDTHILQNPRLRATDGQEATANIGERLPVATGSYQAGVATAVTSSLVNTQFQYLDIGVNIDMKPTVHYDRDVSMKLKIEVSSTNGTEDLGGINEPIITQRKTEQTIRLREGEATILSGLLQHQKSKSASGTPGLGELPLLKYLFSSVTTDDTDDEIVFLLVPHIVRAADITPLNLRQVDTGTSGDIQLRHMGANLSDDDIAGDVPPLPGVKGVVPSNASDSSIARPRPQIPDSTNPAMMTGSIPGQVATAGPSGQPQNGFTSNPAVQGSAGAATAAMAALASGQVGAAAAGGPPPALTLVPSNATQSIGNTFQEQVMLAGGTDVYSVPLQVKYDQTKLQLTNVDVGDMLGRDGQAVALVHRDDGAGNVVISTSRPPGVAGITGAGTVCTLTFQAKAVGDAAISINHPVVRDSKQQPMAATGSAGVVHIK
ncbi:cohesin domain-containing protein [Acidipila sp. EB88]|uniref:cohesin domain-containing protein n=1 Tax=Acidipila sp. EB88 TaxID=2305226 RepID=UPI001315072C|nr:cohesin domain-containing protein [Acidipila sp. EB88]